MSIKKQYIKNSNVCKVTFRIPKEEGKAYKAASVVGDFNNWDAAKGEMSKLKKDGSFSAMLELESGKSYQYRYVLDGSNWLNDAEADGYVTSTFVSVQNCVLDLTK
ncbi:MAG: isoamylase early set domain-containing protein [Ignavibacteriaceae bacterium]|nr:isoamylase early set domain-containing protein [Ignavibacteriaceae bacterium]